MKRILLAFLLACCSVTLIACQPQEDQMILLDKVADISIYQSSGYGGLNEDPFLSIQDGSKSSFENVLQNTRRTNQNIDVTNGKPDYDILIHYENGDTQGLHLLLGESGEESIIMYIGHEENGYIIPPEDTNKLRSVLNVQ